MDKSTKKPQNEVADIFRKYGDDYQRHRPVSGHQRKVIHAISVCRTSHLGGHKMKCEECGYEEPLYNSCRNRHCPKCQGITARKWLKARIKELLPTPYFHEVFTIPHEFNILIPYNERIVYDILFKSASETLLSFSRKEFGGRIGITAILHTWGQTLSRHIHLHCIVTGGALSLDKKRWISCGEHFLFDVQELSKEFRKCFCRKLRKAFKKLKFKYNAADLINPLRFEEFIKEQETKEWVVYAKRPFAGPKTVLEYLSRYTHRIALSNHRIKEIRDDGGIIVDYKDYRDQDKNGKPKSKELQLDYEEFIRRFLLHILPENFVKIRFYGFMGGRSRKENIAKCQELLKTEPEVSELEEEFIAEEENICPCCGKGKMIKQDIINPEGHVIMVRDPGRYSYNFA